MNLQQIFEVPPTIETERLILRQITNSVKDGEQCLEFINDFDVFKYWGAYDLEKYGDSQTGFVPNTDTHSCYDATMENYSLKLELNLVVELKSSSKIIGEVLLYNFEKGVQAELGYRLNLQYTGNGYAKEAANALLNLGFNQLSLERIYLRCHRANTSSRTLAERLGFRTEGLIIKGLLIEHLADYYLMAMLRNEFNQLRTN